MADKPFWEQTYKNKEVSTFSKGPTKDVCDFHESFKSCSRVLDVGCGEGRNSIFLAGKGHKVAAFDISEAGIEKAKYKAEAVGANVEFSVSDLGEYKFKHKYEIILSHGVLHLPEKGIRDDFIRKAQQNTRSGGFNIIGIFTNKRPAAKGLEAFTKSLFEEGELPDKYKDWDVLSHDEGVFNDEHPVGIKHEHAYERIIARKR